MINKTTPWYTGAGATNLSRHEAQRFARSIIESPAYRKSLEERAANGGLPAAVEVALWHYAYGKPPETIIVNPTEELETLSTATLSHRAKSILDRIEKAQNTLQQTEAALDSVPTTTQVM